jgi:endonuclease III-like uncharacterized protein
MKEASKALGKGFEVSQDGMLKFGEEILEKQLKFTDQQWMEMLAEISNHNKDNKLYGLTNVTELGRNGKWRKVEEARRKTLTKELLTGQTQRDRAAAKLYNLVAEDQAGKYKITDLGSQTLNALDNQEGYTSIQKSMTLDVAEKLIKSEGFGSLSAKVQAEISRAANKGKVKA